MADTLTEVKRQVNNLDLNDLNSLYKLRDFILQLSQPLTMTDAEAENNTVYYSTTQSKLSYKDPSGSVHTLY